MIEGINDAAKKAKGALGEAEDTVKGASDDVKETTGSAEDKVKGAASQTE